MLPRGLLLVLQANATWRKIDEKSVPLLLCGYCRSDGFDLPHHRVAA